MIKQNVLSENEKVLLTDVCEMLQVSCRVQAQESRHSSCDDSFIDTEVVFIQLFAGV